MSMRVHTHTWAHVLTMLTGLALTNVENFPGYFRSFFTPPPSPAPRQNAIEAQSGWKQGQQKGRGEQGDEARYLANL